MAVASKPLLFLDVDGVLNAYPPIPGQAIMRVEGYPICVPEGTKERVKRLTEVFEPVWATTWREKAHPSFADVLGLSETWPHIDFMSFKLLSIIEHAFEQKMSGHIIYPWVWIDDDAYWELRQLGLRPDEKRTLVINPVAGLGLTDEHVEQALHFAAKLRDTE